MLKCLLILALVTLEPAAPASPEQSHAPAFAVLELFTSEGCSSCPPAERLLSRIAADATRDGRNVLTLEYHVDYWNHLGWSDPFSNPANSRRQERYATVLGVDPVYTPQLIVNGVEEFVGSDGRRAESALRSALAKPGRTALELHVTRVSGGLRVAYQVSPAPRGAQVCLARLDSLRVTHVGAGENSGRTLAHTNVVREFLSIPLAPNGAGSTTLPGPESPGQAAPRIVAFVQDAATLAILGAARNW